jgi:hypothetical protein
MKDLLCLLSQEIVRFTQDDVIWHKAKNQAKNKSLKRFEDKQR